jgi:predicted RNase H-like HicB family nuclease
MTKFTAYIERDPETGYLIGMVPGIPGAHTQAETIDELLTNLKEVLELCIEDLDLEEKKSLPEFIGIQQVEIAV